MYTFYRDCEPVSEQDDDFETFPAWRMGRSTSGQDTRLPTNNCPTGRSYGGGPRLGSMYMYMYYVYIYLLDHCAVGPEPGRTQHSRAVGPEPGRTLHSREVGPEPGRTLHSREVGPELGRTLHSQQSDTVVVVVVMVQG